ncbi:hypothetical protein [Corynebacterium urogenitale]
MTMSNRPSNDPVSQRKAEMRKYANIARGSLAVGVISLLVGLFLVKIPVLAAVVPIIAVVVFFAATWKIKGIIEHKDEW